MIPRPHIARSAPAKPRIPTLPKQPKPATLREKQTLAPFRGRLAVNHPDPNEPQSKKPMGTRRRFADIREHVKGNKQ